MLLPLVLATMASQALLVVLAPTLVAIGADLGAPVATVGQARSVTALVSVIASVVLTARADRLPVRTLVRWGASLAVAACVLVGTAASTAAFLAAHVVVGLAFAPLLSGGFAGLAAFPPERRAWATGYVAGANALAWIVVNPVAAGLTAALSWRAALAAPATVAVAALATSGAAAPLPSGQPATTLWEPLRYGPARRWLASEVTAFAAWTCLLTFAGAFFIEEVGVTQSAVGWVLAAAAAAYLAASSRAGRLARTVPLRRLCGSQPLRWLRSSPSCWVSCGHRARPWRRSASSPWSPASARLPPPGWRWSSCPITRRRWPRHAPRPPRRATWWAPSSVVPSSPVRATARSAWC